MSIAKRQADLLKTDYLSRIGENDRGLKHAGSALIDAAAFLIAHAQDNLDRGGNVASGDLSSSIRAEEVIIDGSSLTIPILLNDYWKFIDQGVKGTEGGKGKFQFKTKYPSKKMALSILLWMRRRGIRAREFGKYRVEKTRTEQKDERIARKLKKTDSAKAMAYAISTNIKKKGIKPTKFMTNAVRDTEEYMKEKVMNGFKIDIIETIKDGFSDSK